MYYILLREDMAYNGMTLCEGLNEAPENSTIAFSDEKNIFGLLASDDLSMIAEVAIPEGEPKCIAQLCDNISIIKARRIIISNVRPLFYMGTLQKLKSDGAYLHSNNDVLLRVATAKGRLDIVEFLKTDTEMIRIELPDGKKLRVPEVVDVSRLGFFDELEYSLWNTIQEYFEWLDIKEEEDDEPDWATVKEVQETIINILTRSGVKFVF